MSRWRNARCAPVALAALALLGAAEGDRSADRVTASVSLSKSDAQRIRGSWLVTSFTVQGMAHKDAAGMRFVMGDGVATGRGPDGKSWTQKFVLNPRTTPKQIDWHSDGSKLEGIYRFSGEGLTFCLGLGARPRDFKAAEAVIIIQLRREKR